MMKKRVSLALATLLLVSLLAMAMPGAVAYAEGETTTLSAGNRVWFGTYNSNPILWRVLRSGDGKALLISEKTLADTQYASEGPNTWDGSTAKGWCTAFYANWPDGIEKDAILPTSVSEANDKTDKSIITKDGTVSYYYTNGIDFFGAAPLNGEHIFFLSAKEAYELFADDNDRYTSGSDNCWWLRSPDAETDFQAAAVMAAEGVFPMGVTHYFGARPAFHLDLSAVLLTSEVAPGQYKLTLEEDNSSISVPDHAGVTRNGSTVTVPYIIDAGESSGLRDPYVLITKEAYTDGGATVLQYTPLTDENGEGVGTFTLDSSVTGKWGEDYHVYLMAVIRRGDNQTDFACRPVEIEVQPGSGAACVGEKYFETLEAAIADAQAGDTVTLLKDVACAGEIGIDKSLTLDLNHFTVTGEGDAAIRITGETTFINGSINQIPLTLEDGSAVIGDGAMISFAGARPAVIVRGERGRLDVTGGCISCPDGIGVMAASYGTAVITGGEIRASAAILSNNGKVNITGGKLQGRFLTELGGTIVIQMPTDSGAALPVFSATAEELTPFCTDCEPADNTDEATKADYPRTVKQAVVVTCIVEWHDDNNQRGIRPEGITVYLLANGEECQTEEIHAGKGGIWAVQFGHVPMEDAEGNKISYSMIVDEIPGYTTAIEVRSDIHFIIRNSLSGQMDDEDPTPSASPAPQPGPTEDPIQAYVQRCYKNILNREGEEEGVDYWTNLLKTRTATGAEIVRGFVNSPEFISRGLSNEEIVTIFYRAMLGREPEEGGFAFWLGGLNEGYGVDYLVWGFSSAPEFEAICATYGIEAGNIPMPVFTPATAETNALLTQPAEGDVIPEQLPEEPIALPEETAEEEPATEILQPELLSEEPFTLEPDLQTEDLPEMFILPEE